MTDAAALSGALALSNGSDLDVVTDPAQRIIVSCERAKTWLAHALDGDDIEQIVELKSQAEAMRVYVMAKQLGKDAELAAAEFVRRAERCIGLAVRKGQANGRIAKTGEGGGPKNPDRKATRISPKPFFGTTDERHDAYAMADGATDVQFEGAISKGKAENNLSRANVVRKVKGEKAKADRWGKLAELAAGGHTSDQIAKKIGVGRETVKRKAKALGVKIHADEVMGRSRRLKPNRILREFVATLESLVPSCEMIEPAKVDPQVLTECITLMDDAMRALGRMRRRLKEEASNGN